MYWFSVGIAIVLLLLGAGHRLAAQEQRPSAEEALQRLRAGNARFVRGELAPRDLSAQRRRELAKGQHPFAVILACADSRVAPELIFDQGLGDLFVLRVAGNVTDPAILGSIEYAVQHLQVPLVVVLGHDHCGAVAAALGGSPLPGNLGKLIREVHVGQDLPKEPGPALTTAIKNNARQQASRLTQHSTVLRDFAARGRLRVVSAIYLLETGTVEWLETSPK
jgi:carbonic anhydrase